MHHMIKEIVFITGLFQLTARCFVSGFCGTDPTGITVTKKSRTSIHVAWDTTNTKCGYTIIGYRVYFEAVAPVHIFKHKDVTGSSTDNVEIFPIASAFTYSINVKALTANGEVSNPTKISYTHPHTIPSFAPGNIHVTNQGITTLTIEWDALSELTKNGIIKGYKIYYVGPGLKRTQRASRVGENNRTLTVSGLMPNSTYSFIIQAVNDVGSGKMSPRHPFKTLPLPTTNTYTTTMIPSTNTSKTTTPSTTTPLKITTTTTTTPSSTTTPTTATSTKTLPSTKKSAAKTATTKRTITHISLEHQSHLTGFTTTVSSGEDPEKETNNILLKVGIAAGALIFIAILIPLSIFICRNCCLKGPVSPDKDRQDDKAKTREEGGI